MKIKRPQLITWLIFTAALSANAGTLSYVAVSPVQSDVSCGISNEFQYTSAVDGGNATGAARVINGITLSPLSGSGSSATADNCTLNALAGTLTNASETVAAGLPADGTFKEVVSDMTANMDAPDNSQQEIVLDPASLIAGTTYDLRIYIANAGSPDREVNLSFVGDGQPAAETGFFNEDDARTSPGHFSDRNQVYYIDYRFTWDGASTPGVTITQKSGQTPFTFYALTNQPVVEAAVAQVAAAPELTPVPAPPAAEGVTMASVSAKADHVGVASETFYANDSLNKHGRWIEVKKYGRAWQPIDAPSDWRPYSRGHFVHSLEGGYTWVSDTSEADWGWATYHYGRWCRVPGIGSGWAWVPGTVWGGAWVSWRQARSVDDPYVGWAPLPPEAICRVGVGISTWADREYDIGPDYYSFVHVRDFGVDNYSRVILDPRENVTYIERSANITNINYTTVNFGGRHGVNVNIASVSVYNGGPDFQWFNTQIRRHGGREIQQIEIDRVAAPNFAGGRGSELRGNTFVVFTPQVVAQANPKVVPKIAATVPDNKIDHGWAGVKDPKVANNLKSVIAAQTAGQTPVTTKAVLPPQIVSQSVNPPASPIGAQSASPAVAGSVAAGSPPPGAQTQSATNAPPAATSPLPAASQPAPAAPVVASSPTSSVAATQPATAGQHPSPPMAPTGTTPGATAAAAAKNLHPGAKATSALEPGAGVAASPVVTPTAPASIQAQHPGSKITPQTAQTPRAPGAPVTSPTIVAQPAATAKPQHPGAKIPAQSAPSGTPAAGVTPQTSATAASQHPGGKIAPAGEHSPVPAATTSPVTAAQPSPSGKAQHPGATLAPAKAPSPTSSQPAAVTPPPVTQSQPSSAETKGQHPGNKAAPVLQPSPLTHPSITPASTPAPAAERPQLGKGQHPGQKEAKPEFTPAPAAEQHPTLSREPGPAVPAKTNAAPASPQTRHEQLRESPSPKQTPREPERAATPKPEAPREPQPNKPQQAQERVKRPEPALRPTEQKPEQLERSSQPRSEHTPEPQAAKEHQAPQQPRGSGQADQATRQAEQRAEQLERKKQAPAGQREQSQSFKQQQRRPEQQQSQPATAQPREQQLERRTQTQNAPRESQPMRQQPSEQRQQPVEQQQHRVQQQQQEAQPRQVPQRQEQPVMRQPSEQRQQAPSSQPRQQQGNRNTTPTPAPNQ